MCAHIHWTEVLACRISKRETLQGLVLPFVAHSPIWVGAQGTCVAGRYLCHTELDILRPFFEQRWDLIQPMLTTIGTGIISKVRWTGSVGDQWTSPSLKQRSARMCTVSVTFWHNARAQPTHPPTPPHLSRGSQASPAGRRSRRRCGESNNWALPCTEAQSCWHPACAPQYTSFTHLEGC
jgi:hypothetical protein